MATESATPNQEAVDRAVGGSKNDKREWARHDYDYSQGFLPLDNVEDQEVPQLDQFNNVRCVNLSEGGLAFLWAEKPDFQAGVMALGTPPEIIMMKVTVVNVSKNEDGDYIVGCRFTGRVG